MKTRCGCKGGCGKVKVYPVEPDTGGYGMYVNDSLVEWVCDKCWEKGVRTTGHEKAEKNISA